jgi:hypothetical protein
VVRDGSGGFSGGACVAGVGVRVMGGGGSRSSAMVSSVTRSTASALGQWTICFSLAS